MTISLAFPFQRLADIPHYASQVPDLISDAGFNLRDWKLTA
jgi:hypothetical protein